jgi:hypothetical protein
MKSVIMIGLLLLATSIPVNAALETNCVIDENVYPHLICVELLDRTFMYGPYENVPTTETETAVAYIGLVSIQPQGLGPFPVLGFGESHPCDMYVNMDCEGSQGTGIRPSSFDSNTAVCIYRDDVRFRATNEEQWTTLPLFVAEASCPAE